MKRIIALIIAIMAILTLVACGESGNGSETKGPSNDTKAPGTDASDTNAPDTNAPETNAPDDKSSYENSLAVLNAVWGAWKEDDRFPVFGGNREAAVDNAPGEFALTEREEMASMILLPADNTTELKSAASMIHMMNANTFTSAVFETDGDLDALSQALVDAANNTQWMCGFPETIVTYKVDNYVIMAFGHGETIAMFKTAVESAVEGAALIHEGPISFGGGGIAFPM